MAAHDPIIHMPDRLVLQESGRIKRNQATGMDEATRRYLCKKSLSWSEADAQVGSSWGDGHDGMYCIDYEIVEGKIFDEVILNYLGFVTDSVRNPRVVNDITLGGGSVPDSEGNTVSCMYFSPQSSWMWLEEFRPEWVDESIFSQVGTILSTGSLVVSPFATDPYTLLSDLDYHLVVATIDFHTEPWGNNWRCQATNKLLVMPSEY